jgi:hypothetical protein
VQLEADVAALRLVKAEVEFTAADKEKYGQYWEQVSTGRDWYSLLRKFQGDPVGCARLGVMVDGSGTSDVEYVYIIDLDDNSFNAYSAAWEDGARTLIGRYALDNLPVDLDADLDVTRTHGIV